MKLYHYGMCNFNNVGLLSTKNVFPHITQDFNVSRSSEATCFSYRHNFLVQDHHQPHKDSSPSRETKGRNAVRQIMVNARVKAAC